MNDNQNGNLVETTNGSGTYIMTAIIAFAIGFGSAWMIYTKDTDTTKKVATSSKSDSAVNTLVEVDSNIISGAKIEVVPSSDSSKKIVTSTDSSPIISVSNQVAGTEVKVDKVTVSKPAWVAIVDVYEDGSTGYILGAKLFDVGTNSGIVELLRGTVSGKTYAAVIREDNADESFDPKLDLPLKNSSGNIILTKFKAN